MLIRGFGTKSSSGNRKIIGYRTKRKVFATYLPVGPSCPATCKLLPDPVTKKGGCYARFGKMGKQNMRAHTETFDPYLWGINLPYGVLVRWNVSGDVTGEYGPQYRDAIKRVHEERPDLRGWIYTHAWKDQEICDWAMNLPDTVVCIASCDTEQDLVHASILGFRTYSIVQKGTDKGNWDSSTAKVARDSMRYLGDTAGVPTISCPAQRKDRADIGCADCLGCLKPGLIVFASHGAGKQIALKNLGRNVVKPSVTFLPVIQ